MGPVISIVVGALFIAMSRWVAHNVQVTRQQEQPLEGFLRFAGLGRDGWAPFLRWFTCVVTGLVFIGAGVIQLVR